MTPYIILTVHRRYPFLAQNLRHIASIRDSFAVPPKIVVVRADPEPSCDLLFSQWKSDGYLDLTVNRPSLDHNFPFKNISLLESANLVMGHNAIELYRLSRYEATPHYTIVQASDCYAKPEAYKMIDSYFQNKEHSFFGGQFFIWDYVGLHTNFFAYNPLLFQPQLSKTNDYTLEIQYKDKVMAMMLENHDLHFNIGSNNGDSHFVHTHDLYDERLNFLKDGIAYESA